MARSTIYPPSVTPGIPRLGERPEGWLETTYGDVFERVIRKAKIEDEQKYQLVTAKRSRGGIVPRSQLYGREIKTEAQFYICTDDFLISKRQIIHGACGIVPELLDGSIVSGEYSVLRVKSNLLLDYLKYHYHTVYFQQTCFQSSVGVDVEKMIFDLEQWLKFKVYLPPLPEQRKSAAILSTWDESIDLTEQLIAAKQQRRQALMQQLLTGKARFPEFFHSSWQKVKLGEIAKVASGGTPSRVNLEYWNGSIPWITTGSINFNIINKSQQFITQKGLANSSAKWFPPNTILMAMYGQGMTRGRVAILGIKATTNQACAAIMVNQDVDYRYIYFYLTNSYFQIRNLSHGGNQKNLNAGMIKKFNIDLPEYPEQTRISETLQTYDQEIDLLQQKLAALSQQKQGLMQQLLTGKIRVKPA